MINKCILVLISVTALSYSDDSTHATNFCFSQKALIFQINGLYNLSGFQGYLSYKYMLSTQKALRLGVTFGASRTEYLDSSYYSSENIDITGNVGVSALLLYYPAFFPLRFVKFYTGAGPELDYSHQKNTNTEVYTANDSVSFNADGIIGCEWFISNCISLLIEEGVQAGYSTAKYTNTIFGNKNVTTKFYLAETGIRFGISLYF